MHPYKVVLNGRVVGVVEDNVFKKSVRSSKHFLRTPPAIAFDETALAEAQMYGATVVQVLDRDTDAIYETTFERLWENGIPIDRGYGRQVALVIPFWERLN